MPKYLIHVIIASMLVVTTIVFGCPQWNVYNSRLSGEAQLKKAESNRKIAIQEAQAKELSAGYLANAEVIRAEGVAKAQAIINGTLTDRYIRWLQAESISEQECDIRYVPTEAQLPILEARTPKE